MNYIFNVKLKMYDKLIKEILNIIIQLSVHCKRFIIRKNDL